MEVLEGWGSHPGGGREGGETFTAGGKERKRSREKAGQGATSGGCLSLGMGSPPPPPSHVAESLRKSKPKKEGCWVCGSIYLWRTCGVGSPLSGAC